MENYLYPSYPDSSNSSPRSREIDFDNPPPWEDGQPPSYKVKFMCSYGGKIHPRPHDNQLSYNGGETKILSVDRSIRFSAMIARLSALSGDADVAFKYQLPGEELDALISVTNDDDLDHLMHEYDRLYRSTARPARMRLFLFHGDSSEKYGSGSVDGDHFGESLNSGSHAPPDPVKPAAGNADFLFGREKGVPAPPPPQLQSAQTHGGPGRAESGPDPDEIQRQLQELQRLQISGHAPEAMYRRERESNMAGGFTGGGDYYLHKMPEKVAPATAPSAAVNYWHDKQQIIHGGQFSGTVTSVPGPAEQPMYVIHGHGGVYHQPPLIRQMSGQPGQGYYAVQQRVPLPSEMYNAGQPPQAQPPQYHMAAQPPQAQQGSPSHHQQAPKVVEGMGGGRQGGVLVSDGLTYAPAGYDAAMGRQVFYAAGGGMGPPSQQYQGMGAVTAAMETSRRGAGPGG